MISIGDVLYLQHDENKVTVIQRFKCKVMNVEGDTFYTDYPVDEATNRVAYFKTDDEVSASFIQRDTKVNYQFTTRVVGRHKDQIPLLVWEKPSAEEMSSEQRREYVRVDTLLDVAVHSIDETFHPFVTQTLDISGGGCSIVTPHEHMFRGGTKLDLWFSIPDDKKKENHPIRLTGRVVRDNLETGSGPLATSIQFHQILEADRQKIVRYTFARQLELRKRKFEDG
ncbi:MAG: flagellar brake protein [Bacilli bacterium]